MIADNQAGDLVQEGSYGRYHLYSTEGVRKFVSPAGGRTNRFAADWHFYFDQSATAPAPADEVQLHPEQQAEAIAGQSASEEEVKAWHKILLMPDNWPEVVRAEVQAGRQPAGEPVPPPPAQDGAPPAASDRAAPSAPPAAKLIKTGELRAEVDDYAAAAERIETLVAEHGAFIADGGTQETTGGALSGNFVIRVAPARFDALFAALRQVGRIEAENVKVADVTAQYVDLEARIKSLQIAETRLQELAQKELKAEKAGEQMKALLEIERELNRVRTEIEQHEGQLRVLANRVAFSTINIAIHEPPRIVPSAQLGVEVPTLEGAALGLQEIVASLNARLATGQIEKRDNGALAGRYTLTVKLSHFGEALERLAALGRIDQRNVRDWHAPDAAAPWADRVDCTIELVLFERTTTLPAGEVELEVADVSAALVSLRELLPAHQAGVASSQTQQQSDGSSAATVQVRVPAGAFAEVADAIAALGRVLQRNLTGSTQQLAGGAAATPVTLTVRLSEPARQIPSGRFELTVAKFEPARQALVALVQQENVQVLAATSTQRQDGTWAGAFRLGIPAARMEAVIAALEALGDVTTRELTGLGLGELSRVHPQALGVLELSLGEKAAYSPGGLKAGNTLRKYLRDGLSGLYESLGLIVYGLVVMLPWLILVALATFLIVRLWRKPAARRQTPVT